MHEHVIEFFRELDKMMVEEFYDRSWVISRDADDRVIEAKVFPSDLDIDIPGYRWPEELIIQFNGSVGSLARKGVMHMKDELHGS